MKNPMQMATLSYRERTEEEEEEEEEEENYYEFGLYWFMLLFSLMLKFLCVRFESFEAGVKRSRKEYNYAN